MNNYLFFVRKMMPINIQNSILIISGNKIS
jgi:hypothetical protein